MSRRQLLRLLRNGLLIILLLNLQYLPGPAMLLPTTQVLYLIGFIAMVLSIPIVLLLGTFTLYDERGFNSRTYKRKVYVLLYCGTIILSFALGSYLLLPLGRSIAMMDAKMLIDEIEQTKSQTGEYPDSVKIARLNQHTIGAQNYMYRKVGASYELSFDYDVFLLSRQTVVYNPTDGHDAVEDGRVRRSNSAFRHWKYYKADF